MSVESTAPVGARVPAPAGATPGTGRPTVELHSVPDAVEPGQVDPAWTAEVDGVLDRIGAEHSTALRLLYVNRLSIAQAATRLQIPEPAFARRVTAAMSAFSTALLGG